VKSLKIAKMISACVCAVLAVLFSYANVFAEESQAIATNRPMLGVINVFSWILFVAALVTVGFVIFTIMGVLKNQEIPLPKKCLL